MQFTIIHGNNSFGKLMAALINGAVEDILSFCAYPSHQELLSSYALLSYRERKKRMKEYWIAKRRSEKACEWLSEGSQPKKGSTMPYFSFAEACDILNISVQQTREGIKNLIRQERKV